MVVREDKARHKQRKACCRGIVRRHVQEPFRPLNICPRPESQLSNITSDFAIVSIPADAVPAGAIADGNVAIGKLPKTPLWRGQILLDAALSEDAASFHTGLALPSGMRAVALPVSSAAQAMGGAIVPGARVDVLAVPLAGRAPGGRTTELLLQGAMVLDVRSETGTPYGTTVSKSASASLGERIGSVVVAIDPLDEVRFADRIATSMFVLTLAGSR